MTRGASAGIAGAIVLTVSGCALQQERVVRQLEHPAPVSCATAPGDLRLVQSE
jgi:hypothetical protein